MKRPQVSMPVVMRDSPEAATYRTDIRGWVSRDGLYFGDDPGAERTARYSGCTHVPCGRCAVACEKWRTLCDGCASLQERERWEAMPRKAWDGSAMLFSQLTDAYFNSPDDAADSLEEGQTLDDLQLIICEPNRGRRLTEDHFSDELPEDGDYHDLPAILTDAVAAFNAAIDAAPPLSWSPGKFALQLDTPCKATETVA